MLKNTRLIALIIFLAAFVLYTATSPGKTPYNYFVRLADAFNHGRNYITDNPSWLSELIPGGDNKFFIAYPPMPAIILMPLVAVFGTEFPQQLLSEALGAGIVSLTFLIALTIKKDYRLGLWAAAMIGAGSIVWFMSSVGSVWYLGQISAAFFMTAAIYEALSSRRALFIGILLGASFLSRINVIVAVPFFLYLAANAANDKFRKVIEILIGLTPFILFYLIYNYVRFGNPLENGYFLLPSVLGETQMPWFIHGVASPLYIMDNVRAAFFTFPKHIPNFPYIEPSWYGLAIWITTPAFVFSLLANLKEKVVLVAWITVILLFGSVAVHGGTGWAQFGYRFAVDLYPILMFLTINGVGRTNVRWYHWIFLIAGILVNTWGVVWINKFGWVSF